MNPPPDDIDRQMDALSEAEAFDGILLRRRKVGPGNTPDDYVIRLVGPPGIGVADLRRMLESVLERVSATPELATKDVVSELVSRPGFNGVVVRVPHIEAAELRGGAELVASFNTKRLDPAQAIQMLRAAANTIEEKTRQ